MILILICILCTIGLGYYLRKSTEMLTACIGFLLVSVIVSCCVLDSSRATDMKSVNVISAEEYRLSTVDPVTVTADNATIRISYTLESGDVANVLGSRARLFYDSTDYPYFICYTYKHKDIRGFLYTGYPYVYYEFHLCD